MWWADLQSGELVHTSAYGEELLRVTLPPDFAYGLTLDSRDGSCWVTGSSDLKQVSTDGSILTSLARPWAIPDLTTGTCWGTDWAGGYVGWTYEYLGFDTLRHYGNGGNEWEEGEYFAPTVGELSQLCDYHPFFWDEASRSFWIWNNRLDLVSATETGEELCRHTPLTESWEVMAFNPNDGSLTFVDGTAAAALQITRDGGERPISLTYTPSPVNPSAATVVALDPRDGSFWVCLRDGRTAATGRSAIPGLFHLSADGMGLSEIPATGVQALAVDPVDGSLWASETYPERRLARFTADGTELWHNTNLGGPSLYVYSADGSCWAGTQHIAKDGMLLSSFSAPYTGTGAADPVIGFYWCTHGPYVWAYTSAGRCLWQGGGVSSATNVQVSIRDGSIWLYSTNQGQIVHLWVPVTVFPDVLYDNWAAYGVSLCYRAGIVGGYSDGNYHPEYVVTRAQMAVFVSRALAKGDKNVPPGAGDRSLPGRADRLLGL